MILTTDRPLIWKISIRNRSSYPLRLVLGWVFGVGRSNGASSVFGWINPRWRLTYTRVFDSEALHTIGNTDIFTCDSLKPTAVIGLCETVWVKNPPCDLRFSDIFSQTVENFKSVFTHLLYVPIYARLQIFIQISQILTKLCHIISSSHNMLNMSTIGWNARVQAFAKVVDSFVGRCLWQVIPADLLLL